MPHGTEIVLFLWLLFMLHKAGQFGTYGWSRLIRFILHSTEHSNMNERDRPNFFYSSWALNYQNYEQSEQKLSTFLENKVLSKCN